MEQPQLLTIQLEQAQQAVRQRIPNPTAAIALILGSGYSDFINELTERIEIPYTDIPHFAKTTVAGHRGSLIYGLTRDRVALFVLAGRFHYYEGHPLHHVVFPTRLLVTLGARTILLTNAAGSTHSYLTPGTVMLIRDHINLMGDNPLIGAQGDTCGPRFVDMTNCYDKRLQELALKASKQPDIRRTLKLASGVYAALTGPSYETAAEIKMLSRLGVDAVGMSTVPETIAARQMGARVLGLSLITNLGTGLLRKSTPITHAEVLQIVDKVRPTLFRFLNRIISEIHKEKNDTHINKDASRKRTTGKA